MPILFGSDQIVAEPELASYNAAFLLSPDGETAAVYRKIHLVPFGEFFPLQELAHVRRATRQAASLPFTPGDSVVMLPVERPSGEHRDLLRSRVPVADA